jgi:hypothetical protein
MIINECLIPNSLDQVTLLTCVLEVLISNLAWDTVLCEVFCGVIFFSVIVAPLFVVYVATLLLCLPYTVDDRRVNINTERFWSDA